MTTAASAAYDLRVQLWDSNGLYGEANYEGFTLGDSTSNYALTVGTYKPTEGDIPEALDSFGLQGAPAFLHANDGVADDPTTCTWQNSPGW